MYIILIIIINMSSGNDSNNKENDILNKDKLNRESFNKFMSINPHSLEEKPEHIAEYFIKDPKLKQEYKDQFKPFYDRGIYTLFYDTFVFYAIWQYAKNIDYYLPKYFPNRGNKLKDLLFVSFIHCAAFSTFLIGGNLLILGIRPIKFAKRLGELNERIIQEDPNPNMTWNEFVSLVSNHVNFEEVMKENKNGNTKNTDSNKSNNNDDVKQDIAEVNKEIKDLMDLKKSNEKI